MANIIEYKERDDYGRAVYHQVAEGRHVVIVVLPKVWVEANPGKGRYLVNNWDHPVWIDGAHQGEAEGKLVYCHRLNEARAVAAGMLGA